MKKSSMRQLDVAYYLLVGVLIGVLCVLGAMLIGDKNTPTIEDCEKECATYDQKCVSYGANLIYNDATLQGTEWKKHYKCLRPGVVITTIPPRTDIILEKD